LHRVVGITAPVLAYTWGDFINGHSIMLNASFGAERSAPREYHGVPENTSQRILSQRILEYSPENTRKAPGSIREYQDQREHQRVLESKIDTEAPESTTTLTRILSPLV
jgi:hypothetical protein